MKKILLASAIALGISGGISTLQNTPIEAHAKEYDMKPNFASALKKGTMPYAKGKIGMNYGTLSKKAPLAYLEVTNRISYYHERSKNDYDEYIFNKNGLSPKSKVKSMQRIYYYLISPRSAIKYFGKPVKSTFGRSYGYDSAIYKSGKNYIAIIQYMDAGIEGTFVIIGTKKFAYDSFRAFT